MSALDAYLLPLANDGDARSQVMIGIMYKDGEGVPQDYKQAISWYIKAAEQDDVVAQYNLGLCTRQKNILS